jgi:hypothetical protein
MGEKRALGPTDSKQSSWNANLLLHCTEFAKVKLLERKELFTKHWSATCRRSYMTPITAAPTSTNSHKIYFE